MAEEPKLVVIDMRSTGKMKESTTAVEILGESLRRYGKTCTFECVARLFPEATPFIDVAEFMNRIRWQTEDEVNFSIIRRPKQIDRLVIRKEGKQG